MLNNIKYSSMHQGKTIIHFVGGKLTQDLAENLESIAWWVLNNDITILWGDDYQEKDNPNHPVAALINKVKQLAKVNGKAFNTPIRILQLGKDYGYVQNAGKAVDKVGTIDDWGEFVADKTLGAESAFTDSNPRTNLCEVYDDSNKLIGYLDTAVKEEITIYTQQQQDRQRAYYNNADGLFVLPGGVGCRYEIANALIYTFSGDLKNNFPIYVIDDIPAIMHPWDEEIKGSYQQFIKAYANPNGDAVGLEKRLFKHYYKNATDFVDRELTDTNTLDI